MYGIYTEILEQFFKSEIIHDYSLEKITRACEYFGNPQNSFKSIHIAGTNGKGSVSKMIFQILKEGGKKVGVYTSPHNISICERFEINEGLISQVDFVSYAQQIIDYDGGLSYYERCVLLAFLYFRDAGCEYAVIEVGMGGRLDATNMIMPILSIITSISYDHMEYLGDTLEKIATEKGGIIKPGIPVILYDQNSTLESIANARGSSMIFPEKRKINTNLLGDHQISNAQMAFEAGIFLAIPENIIQKALLHIDHPGRLQYIHHNILIDGAHNEDGMQKLKTYLAGEVGKWENVVYCFNLKSGKRADLVLGIFSEVQQWYIIQSSGWQVCDAQDMLGQVEQLGKQAEIITPLCIFDEAQRNPNTLFVIFGSLYMMGEFLGR